VSRRVPTLLDEPGEPGMEGHWRALLPSLLIFEVRGGGEAYFFCVDARDSARAGASRGEGYHLPLLRRVRRYFKVNHDPAAGAEDDALRPFAAVIAPADPFFAIRPARAFDALPRLRPAPEAGWDAAARLRRVKALW